MKIIFTTIAIFFAFASLQAQDVILWQKGVPAIKLSTAELDSIRITPCDTNIYDLAGCDLDIDTALVSVICGNTVSVQTVFDGTPSYIKYTIFDSAGTVVFVAFNSSQLTFTLPGTGVFYGLVEASCGGGEKNGGDEDEEAFEIINSAPKADFTLKATTKCVGGSLVKNIVTTDFSQEDSLTYLWKVTDLATGIVTNYNTPEPSYSLSGTKRYNVELVVTDTKGCQSTRSESIDSTITCNASFDWWYSWCETCKEGTKTDVVVNFENNSTYANCANTPTFLWEFGDSTTSSLENPQHTYLKVPCPGKNFQVRLTITSGLPTDSNFFQTVWDTMITINNQKVEVAVDKICCDGLVFFHTDARKGKWNTPGSMGIPKWPAVSKKIWKPLGIQIGQNYRQYYNTTGIHYIVVNGAETEDHNRCPVARVEFTIDKIDCFNRNVKIKGTDVVGGVSVKYKFKALALPLVHRMKSKIKTVGFKKAAEISTDFAGEINKKDVFGCYCATQNVSDNGGGVKTNKRKAKASTSTNGKFRIGMDKATANFYIKTKNGATKTWVLKLGYPPCDHPWFLFF